MKLEAQEFYQQERDKQLLICKKLEKQIKKYSRIRLVWFIIGMILIYYSSSEGWFWFGFFLLLFIISFAMIAIRHGHLMAKKKREDKYQKLIIQETEAIKGNYSSFNTGSEYINKQHPFSSDLDIFGNKSIFQMLDRGFSNKGRERLANTLRELENNVSDILNRQEAIEELSENPSWTIRFRVLGNIAFTKENSYSPDPNILAKNLPLWITRKSIFNKNIFIVAQYVLPLISWIALAFYINDDISSMEFLFYVIISLGFTSLYSSKINKQHQELSKQAAVLFRFKDLIRVLELEEFKSKRLLMLQKEFTLEKNTVSGALNELGKITEAFDSRLNMLVWPILNYFLLWDIRQSIRLEHWKAKYASLTETVFNSIAEMEMLVSLSTFLYNREDVIFPELSENEFGVEGKLVGHPLMSQESRVDNDISFGHKGLFCIITGANMAGKSTYLRTVGVNLILALIGAPVCAQYFKTSIFKPFTSIKTTDSLSDNESYFYAELLRLQRIIEALQSGENHFIILDEILKGTNSNDKEQGSRALLEKLIALNAVGIIATHDLELAKMINRFPENIKNACFEVELSEGNLTFDYTLRDGVSQNLNATFLMKRMGIS